MTPQATYRLQFHAGFTFTDAIAIVPYLAELGVSHVYASPIFAARPGSTHGYDVIDPTRLNPELGSDEDFERLVTSLHKHSMGMILDIVPNHMAVSTDNPWWNDVLAKGRESQYAKFFDIAWDDADDKVVLPTLGASLEDSIAEGDVEREGNQLRVYDDTLPLAPGTPRGPIDAVLEHQHYKLDYWRDTLPNYRRFFEINDLVGVCVEDQDVFDATHALALRLLADGKIDGLRIDHVDGLRDPFTYLRTLRQRTGDDAYIVVEKILADGEALPSNWPINGTTGYDFLGMANGLFVDGTGLRTLSGVYRRFVGDSTPMAKIVHRRKRTILEERFPRRLEWLAESFARTTKTSKKLAHEAVLELSSCLPVYRTYITAEGTSAADAAYVTAATEQAIAEGGDVPAIERLRDLIINAPSDPRALEFVLRWQQLTGPAMAKGLEDSTFYRYNRLVSLNEVGGHAASATPPAFHRFSRARARRWPHAMNASSTHDTKRSEDVRARLAGLAEEPRIWDTFVHDITHTAQGHGAPDIDANTEYHLWQAAIGCWPGLAAMNGYALRLTGYLTKAVREAAEHTSWTTNDDAYESSIADFAAWLATDRRAASVRTKIDRYVRRLDQTASKRSLAQLTLKLTASGIPDVYQGQELWDHSFVDPDNRRPVDYAARQHILDEVEDNGLALRNLLRNDDEGRAKLFVTHRLLLLRREHPKLFASPSYRALAPRERALLAFARHLRNDWLIVVAPRLFNTKPQQLDLALPHGAPKAWRDVLSNRTVHTRDGVLPVAISIRAGLPLVLTPR